MVAADQNKRGPKCRFDILKKMRSLRWESKIHDVWTFKGIVHVYYRVVKNAPKMSMQTPHEYDALVTELNAR